MKQFLLLLGMMFAVWGEALAQRTFILSTLRHKTSISLTAALSKPTVSPFGKNTQNFLENGQSLQLSMSHRLGWHWGVAGSYTYNTNPVRPNDLLRLVRENVEQPAVAPSAPTHCTLQSAMAGPMFTVQASRFVFDLQLSAGYAQATSFHPSTGTQNQQADKANPSEARTIGALAAGGGIRVHYKIYRWLALHASAQYIASDMDYNDLYQEVKPIRLNPIKIVSPHQPLGLLNVGGGLSFLF